MYSVTTRCRACSGTELSTVFDLGNQPLANNHCLPTEARQGFYPLSILFCKGCGLAQLSAVVDRHILYDKYSYVTSDSLTMQRHFDRLFKDIESEGVEKRLVEIGSNDGRLLDFAKQRGFAVVGIEPAKNLAAIANSHGLPTIPHFFGLEALDAFKMSVNASPGVILARHCFAHVDNWNDFFGVMELMAGADTLVCIEVPYVGDMLDKTEWDTIYHEHLSYVSLKPVALCAGRAGWRIHRVIHYAIHGGAKLIMLRRKANQSQAHLSADEYLAEENITIERWNAKFEGDHIARSFAERANSKIRALQKLVRELRSKSEIISCFGASAKCTVLINACQFTEKDIAFVTDNSPLKPGRLIPGTQIPIIEEGEMLSHHPDYSLVSAWNYKSEILQKMDKYRKRGGRFIFPTHEGWEII